MADVFGRPGRRALEWGLARLGAPDGLLVVNGENAAGGFGITPARSRANSLARGTDVITTGNHVWDKREIYDFLDTEPRLLRPDNYPREIPDAGSGRARRAVCRARSSIFRGGSS